MNPMELETISVDKYMHELACYVEETSLEHTETACSDSASSYKQTLHVWGAGAVALPSLLFCNPHPKWGRLYRLLPIIHSLFFMN